MLRQVPVAAVVHAFDFLPAEREFVIDVDGCVGVVGEFIRFVRTIANAPLIQTDVSVELQTLGSPIFEPLVSLARMAEELHLGLFEFTRAEGKVARRNFVAEGLAYLGNPKRDLLPGRLAHTLEARKERLAGFRPQVGRLGGVRRSADLGLQHQVEVPGFGQVVLRAALSRRTLPCVVKLIGAKAFLARPAIHHRVAEVIDVARRFPGSRMRDDRRVDTDDVRALSNHALPPQRFQVVLEFDTKRAVVPKTVNPAVNLTRRKDKPSGCAKRNQLVHRDEWTCGA